LLLQPQFFLPISSFRCSSGYGPVVDKGSISNRSTSAYHPEPIYDSHQIAATQDGHKRQKPAAAVSFDSLLASMVSKVYDRILHHDTLELHGREEAMELQPLIEKVKRHPEFHQAGMLLCHCGVVRATSRDGRKVKGLTVAVDQTGLQELIAGQRQRPGIVDIQVAVAADRYLSVGDDVMFLVVAGDVRENVIAVLQDTLQAIKTKVTRKTEDFEG
jgi:molybdopterin synthase catalytic subunit